MTRTTQQHILIVDDDDKLRSLLGKFLHEQGYAITEVADSKAARAVMQSLIPDLVVLDVMMPFERGTILAGELRTKKSSPVLMLTALGEAQDRIEGLEAGADDYLAKPFQPKELLLRIRNILDRVSRSDDTARMIQFGEFVFYTATGNLKRSGELVYLTTSEQLCLRALAQSLGQPVAREILASASGDMGSSNERSIDVLINRLRKKIEANPSKPRYIQTVRHLGYALVVDTTLG
jgi:two-component system, OmpR family, phosphate regulon response regulator OmpR